MTGDFETITFDFGVLKVGDRLIIGEVNEGTDISMDAAIEVMRVAEDRFDGRPWGYISNRIHSYSLQPTVYFEASGIPSDMAALAIVADSPSKKKQASFEKQVSPGPYEFECFFELEPAVDWIKKVLNSS